MGQKVNPISLRLEKTNRHFDSCWYEDYNYTDLLLQDLKIKNYFKTPPRTMVCAEVVAAPRTHPQPISGGN